MTFMWINVKWCSYEEEGEYNIPTSPIKWWILSSFYHTGIWCGIWCFLWSLGCIHKPILKGMRRQAATIPIRSTAQDSAHPPDSSANIRPAGYCYVEREKSKAVTLSADTPWLFRKMLRRCLIVMLILRWGRWLQPFKREDILTPAGSSFSMEWTREETSWSSTSSPFKGYRHERSPRVTAALVP